jgi:cytochrome c oxidase subunit 1
MFVIGGISGVMLGSVPVDLHMHDTYFVVSHFHFVLFGGSVFAIYSGFYHWWPKISGRMLDERLGKLHFALTYLGFFFTFFPMHILGMRGMPRRVAIYDPQFQDMNTLVSLSAFVLGISTFVFVYNLLWSVYNGKVAGANPWRALTLEWMTSSPPPPYNFVGDPIPFEDPYGYGTEASRIYLDTMEKRLGGGSGTPQPAPEPDKPAPAAPEPAGD